MKSLKHILLASAAIALAACQNPQDSETKSAMGHDHAAMQSGQTKSPAVNTSQTETGQYTCPMHPHYISDDPNGTCPICGMDLVPTAGGAAQSGAIAVSPEMIQTMGVRTLTVGTSDMSTSMRAFGTVQPNTRLESVAASRLEGWISNLTVRAEGDVVRSGQRLYNIYTPDLIAAQKDYLASLQIGNQSRIASVRQRLKSKGMQDNLIKRLTEKREVIESLPIYAESAGVVTQLMVRDGDYLKPGDPVMQLQSYQKVWVIASVPESQLAQIAVGQKTVLEFESAPQANQPGEVDYIYPTIDTKTRTANVRISVDNPDGILRPGAYANIVFETNDSSAHDLSITIPTQAILRDSHGAHVITALGEGKFEARDIRIGRSYNGRTEVLSGLKAGETIVASGQFMLDSEANLRNGLSKLSPVAATFNALTPLSGLPIDASALSQIDHVVDAALYLHEALIDGYDIDPYYLGVALTAIERLETTFANSKLSPILNEAKLTLTQAQISKSGPALAQDLAALTAALRPWLLQGAPSHYKSKGLTLYADSQTRQLWLQSTGLPANPYANSSAAAIEWPEGMTGSNQSDKP